MTASRKAVNRLPVSLIGGYLGVGKTTLLNRVLKEPHGQRLAVMVNDFGAISIDAELIAEETSDMVSLANGCICCSIGDDLGFAILDLLDLDPRPDHLIIEASGVAEPARVRGILSMLPRLRIATTIVMAEAAGLPELAADNQIGGLIRSQLSAADLLILNKTDLARPPQLTASRRWLTENLPDIPVLEAAHADLPAAMILGAEAVEPLAPPPTHQHGPEFAHTLFTTDKPLDRETFRKILDQLAPHIVRAKGFVRFADNPDALEVLQLTGRRWSLEDAGMRGANNLSTRLVFIALAAGFDENELLTRISNPVDNPRPMADHIGGEHGG